jgi:hypothetical protein
MRALSLKQFVLGCGLFACASLAQAGDPLFEGSFSGGVEYPHSGAFDGISTLSPAAMSFSGQISFDGALVPAAGSGFFNVAIPLGNPVFNVSIGANPLTLNYTQGEVIAGGPGNQIQGFVQYNNGVFAGAVFEGDFMVGATPYRLDMQGPTWTIFQTQGFGGPELGEVAYGYFNQGLTNVQSIPTLPPISGAVPEPSEVLMMAAGLALLITYARRRAALRPVRI